MRHTIAYDKNGGTGTNFTQTVEKWQNEVGLSYGTQFSKSGATLTGWNTASNGSGITYSLGGTYAGLTHISGGTITLYAQWTSNAPTTKYTTGSANGTATGGTYANPTEVTLGDRKSVV